MLELRDVTHRAGREDVLSRAGIVFAREAPHTVLGLSRAGREGLLRVLSGIERPVTGSVRLDGLDVALARRKKGRIARIGLEGLTVSGQRVARLVSPEAAARVRLSGRMEVRVNALDLDQRLRLAIAAALDQKPALILLDAVGEGLEGEVRDRFLADLGTVLAGAGTVVIMAAESADAALALGGQVHILAKGRVVQQGSARDVFAHPINLAAALSTSFPALNKLPMEVREDRIVLADGSRFSPPEGIVLPAKGACTLAFRPEDTTLSRSGESCVRFVVRAAPGQVLAGRRYHSMTCAGETWLVPQLNPGVPPVGTVHNAFIDRSRLMVFDAAGEALG